MTWAASPTTTTLFFANDPRGLTGKPERLSRCEGRKSRRANLAAPNPVHGRSSNRRERAVASISSCVSIQTRLEVLPGPGTTVRGPTGDAIRSRCRDGRVGARTSSQSQIADMSSSTPRSLRPCACAEERPSAATTSRAAESSPVRKVRVTPSAPISTDATPGSAHALRHRPHAVSRAPVRAIFGIL